MKTISKIILVGIIVLILFIFYFEWEDDKRDEHFIRAELETKGLPTPAFASKNELEKILKTA